VLLQNALEDFRRGRVVPDAIGIHDRDGSMLADAEAVGLGSVDAAVRAGQLSLGESLLEVIPGRACDFGRSTFGLGLLRAEENMPLNFADTKVAGNLGQPGFCIIDWQLEAAPISLQLYRVLPADRMLCV